MPLARPGDQLKDDKGNTYTIEAYLGEGVTAEVYKAKLVEDKTLVPHSQGDTAEVHTTKRTGGELVALKILRPNLPKEIGQSFWNEAVILTELAGYSRDRFPNDPLHTPRLLGRSPENASSKFLAIEFVTGQSLDELIISSRGLVKSGREVEGLTVARHVLQVLVILHEDLRRSYIDFQLKNIWWISDDASTKVMDWNHVSVPTEDGVIPPGSAGDLIRFGAYLYHLLTGKAAFQTGETEAELAARADINWTKISLGTRTVLLKALHPNPASRYQTAQDFLADIEAMLALWQQDEDDLYDEANIALQQAKSRSPQSGSEKEIVEEYKKAVYTAAITVDLYTRRGSQGRAVERMSGELKKLTDDVSPVWGIGKDYYQLGFFSETLQQWEPEARNLERLDLWRWVVLAQIGRELSPAMGDAYTPVKALLEETVDQLNRREWTLAQNSLRQVQAQAGTRALFSTLRYEAEAQNAVEEARSAEKIHKWGDAGNSYKQASESLKQIQDPTYLQLLARDLSTPEQLFKKAEECHQQDKGFEQESAAIKEFHSRLSGSEQPVGYLVEKLLENPAQLRLIDAVAQEADKLPIEDAIFLLSTAAFYGQTTPLVYERLAALWRAHYEAEQQQLITNYENQLQQERIEKAVVAAAAHQTWLQEQTVKLQAALRELKWDEVRTTVAGMGADVPPETRQTIQTMFDRSIDYRDWALAGVLGEILTLFCTDEEKSVVRDKLSQAHLSQEIELKWVQLDGYLLTKQYSQAAKLLTKIEEQVSHIHIMAERNAGIKALEAKREQLKQLETEFTQEVSIEQVVATLDQSGLQGLGMTVKNNLQSLGEEVTAVEKEVAAVKQQNSELIEANRKTQEQLQKSKGITRRMGCLMFLVILLAVASLAGASVFIKVTQIDPMATQIANLAGLPPQPTLEGTPSSLDTVEPVAPLTETPTMTPTDTPTPTPTPTNTPTPTPTPIPSIETSMTINSMPVPTLDFRVPTSASDPTLILPFQIPGVSGGDLDTVFDWPTFTLTLSNDWYFDPSGDTVTVKHEGVDPQPLHVTIEAETGEVALADVPVSSSWIITDSIITSNSNMSLVYTISIDGSKIRDDLPEPGNYVVTWYADEKSLDTSGPLPYLQLITATWTTSGPLRTQPSWDNIYDKDKAALGINESEKVVTVHGFVCSVSQKHDNLFMFLAITLDNDPDQIYWLRNNTTKEFSSEQFDFQLLGNAFDGVQECVSEAKNTTPAQDEQPTSQE